MPDQRGVSIQRAVQRNVARVAHDRKVGALEGIGRVAFDRQRQQLVAPELVHAATERALRVAGVVDEELPVRLGDVPILELPGIVVVTGRFVGQNLSEALGAVVALLPALALVSSAGGKLGLGQLVLDEPQAQCSGMVPVGDGQSPCPD